MDEDERDRLWCLRVFTMLDLGGVWITPRNGLVLRKQSLSPPTFRLVNKTVSMYQLEELDLYREKFGLAGIEIV